MRTAGGRILDTHSDSDHHRTVFTLVGPPPRIPDVLSALTGRVLERCDIRNHVGVHPRTGLVDVVPLVPLGRTTMTECIDAAAEVGRCLAEGFGLPVLLYGAASRRPATRTPAAIRREGMAGLTRWLAKEGPDFGPRTPHPRGGVALVGARPLLVAYNVLLDSSDLRLAQSIAAAVRETGGGLKGVQALGFYLASRDRVQVSMNLTDLSALAVVDVFQAVTTEAERHGASVQESEFVGLVPEVALRGATSEALMMKSDPQLASLERRLETAHP